MKILVIPWAEINSLWLSPSVSHLIFQNQSTRTHLEKPDYFSQKEFQSVYWIFLFCFAFFWYRSNEEVAQWIYLSLWTRTEEVKQCCITRNSPLSSHGAWGGVLGEEWIQNYVLRLYSPLIWSSSVIVTDLKKAKNLLLQQFFDYRTSYSYSSKSY